MKYSKIICTLFLFAFCGTRFGIAQSIVINEIMSDNENTIIDDDGDYSDWIELYNTGQTNINLEGYHLSDKKDNLQKWTFPSVEIGSGDFLLLFASGKDKVESPTLHTNFKISSGGEKLYLSNSLEILIDEIDSVSLKKDQSLGRLPDGDTNIDILFFASPGSSNNTSSTLGFSHQAGFYSKEIQLSITSLVGDSIFYTLDGSEPSPQKNLYTQKLKLKDNSAEPNIWCEIRTTPEQNLITNPAWVSPGFPVTKANIIRCASFKNNIKTSKTYTRSYFIADDVFDRYDMPVVSLITEGSNFFDHHNGIYIPGANYDSENPEWTGNYFTSELESERPIHIELFEKNGDLGFSQDAGVRIHGGKTRHAAQKSLRLYARKDYGDKYFRYQLFPQKEVDKYRRFIIQTTVGAWGGDSVIKDVLAHEIVRDMDFEKMDNRPAIVFLNGEYWGIHQIRDRMDENYLAYTSSLDIDSLEIDTKGNGHFNNLTNYFKDQIPIDNEEYNYISTQMDIDSYIDYEIAEMYLNNFDWPANNSKHWRPKKTNGKWRWMFYDIDGGFREYTYDMFAHNTNEDSSISYPNPVKSTLYFRSLIKNELFQKQFLDRYKQLIENDFRFSITKEKLDILVKQYLPQMPTHIARWHNPPSINSWLNDIDTDLTTFLENRSCAVVDQIKDFFDLDEFEVVCKDTTKVEEKPNLIEELSIVPNPNHGVFDISNTSQNTYYADLSLYNAIGKLISNTTNVVIAANGYYSYENDHLATGVYHLKIKNNDTSIFIPIVVVDY